MTPGTRDSTWSQILTLASWDEKTVLLRIGHQFGVDEDRCSAEGMVRSWTKLIVGQILPI